MKPEVLFSKIVSRVHKSPEDTGAYQDLLSLCLDLAEEDPETAHRWARILRDLSHSAIGESYQKGLPVSVTGDFFEIYRRCLLFDAPRDFDAYLLYVEMNREPQKKFYVPRRKVLLPLVQDLQDLADGKIDFLGVSLPPRVGKSTLCIFFMTWIMGRNPDVANVMSGHSDKLTEGFYRELLSIIQNSEYLWHDVFPGVSLAGTSAKNETIDLGKPKRFPTMTCRSVSGTLTGAVEIGNGGILYCDDLIEDLEESLNPLRLQAKYDAYLNQLKDRKKQGARELMVGTRWNVMDPLGRIREQYEGNERYRFRVIPALNDDGESNFKYQYDLGFDTRYYLDMRASIDDATWMAKYQGNPYVREGLLFPRDELNYYNGVLPDGDPVKIAVCDVAWGGGDSLSMPFACQYGEDVYIADWIFNKGDKEITRPVVIGRLKQHMPHKVRFEANNGGHEYAQIVDQRLREDGVHLNISARTTLGTQAKLARIIQFAPDIKRFFFLDESHQSKEYRAAMKEVNTFVQTGKNLHDDAPDALAMLADTLFHGEGTVEVFRRRY